MTDLVASAAGEVLGPRPGKAACSFGQGVLEMVLRVGALVLGVLIIVLGGITVGFNEQYEPAINELNINNTQTQTLASGSLDIISGVLVVVWAVIMIVLRILNIGLLNLKSKPFLAVDIIVNIVLAVITLVVGIINGVFSDPWDTLNGNDADAPYGTMIAAALVCFITAIYLLTFAVYMIVYLIKDWNDKIIKYTIKDAVMG